MAGDERTGVSIMRLTAGLDSGPVCLSASEPIHADDTFGSLAGRLERAGGDLLLSALGALDRGEALAFAEQDERTVTYAEKIGPADRLLDPRHPAVELERAVRALSPHIGARVELSDGSLLGVQRAAMARLPAADARLRVGHTRPRWPAAAWTAWRARLSCSKSSRPESARWQPRPSCAGTACHRCEQAHSGGAGADRSSRRRPWQGRRRRSAGATRKRPNCASTALCLCRAAPRIRAGRLRRSRAASRGCRARRARPRAYDAPCLRRDPTTGHARPRDRTARWSPLRADRRARAGGTAARPV